CLRPPLQLGRPGVHFVPIEEKAWPLLNPEIVAGLIEPGDVGEEGIKRRAAVEAAEETGYQVSPADVILLGAPSMPVPGLLPQREYYTAIEIPSGAVQGAMPGDGSPMEDGAKMSWRDLDDAIAACVRGEIQDGKSEITLRRLADWLRTKK